MTSPTTPTSAPTAFDTGQRRGRATLGPPSLQSMNHRRKKAVLGARQFHEPAGAMTPPVETLFAGKKCILFRTRSSQNGPLGPGFAGAGELGHSIRPGLLGTEKRPTCRNRRRRRRCPNCRPATHGRRRWGRRRGGWRLRHRACHTNQTANWPLALIMHPLLWCRALTTEVIGNE